MQTIMLTDRTLNIRFKSVTHTHNRRGTVSGAHVAFSVTEIIPETVNTGGSSTTLPQEQDIFDIVIEVKETDLNACRHDAAVKLAEKLADLSRGLSVPESN